MLTRRLDEKLAVKLVEIVKTRAVISMGRRKAAPLIQS
jgi:hypothetical protein